MADNKIIALEQLAHYDELVKEYIAENITSGMYNPDPELPMRTGGLFVDTVEGYLKIAQKVSGGQVETWIDVQTAPKIFTKYLTKVSDDEYVATIEPGDYGNLEKGGYTMVGIYNATGEVPYKFYLSDFSYTKEDAGYESYCGLVCTYNQEKDTVQYWSAYIMFSTNTLHIVKTTLGGGSVSYDDLYPDGEQIGTLWSGGESTAVHIPPTPCIETVAVESVGGSSEHLQGTLTADQLTAVMTKGHIIKGALDIGTGTLWALMGTIAYDPSWEEDKYLTTSFKLDSDPTDPENVPMEYKVVINTTTRVLDAYYIGTGGGGDVGYESYIPEGTPYYALGQVTSGGVGAGDVNVPISESITKDAEYFVRGATVYSFLNDKIERWDTLPAVSDTPGKIVLYDNDAYQCKYEVAKGYYWEKLNTKQILYGTTEPESTVGSDGDLYIMYAS